MVFRILSSFYYNLFKKKTFYRLNKKALSNLKYGSHIIYLKVDLKVFI